MRGFDLIDWLFCVMILLGISILAAVSFFLWKAVLQ